MKDLRFTLLTDGPSDQVLLRHLTWLLQQHLPATAVQPMWAELRRLTRPPRSLTEKIGTALDLFPCDLLFVHRDAEKDDPRVRLREIDTAVSQLAREVPPFVCVVPVRMQEAWLLFDEHAIRRAAGNPHGSQRISLPKPGEIESLPDPKRCLHQMLRDASGLSGRRLKKFSERHAAKRVADLIEDFSPLRALSAFADLESRITSVIRANGWR